MQTQGARQDDPGEGGNNDVHDIDEQRVEAQDAEEGRQSEFLEAKGEDEHAEAADKRDKQEFDLVDLWPAKVVDLGSDEDGGDAEQGIGVFEECLGLLVEKKVRDRVSEGEEDIELHWIGDHADGLAPG